jgi:hypothetical protein
MMFPDPSNDKQKTALRLAAERASTTRNTQTDFEQRIHIAPDSLGKRYNSAGLAVPDLRRVQQR